MKTCKICGREYKRKSCEYCSRTKQWVETIQEKRMIKYLTPRINKDLKNLPFPDIPIVEGCYLYGKVCTGKTLKAATIFLEKQKEDYLNNIPSTYEFITVPNLLLKIRQIFDGKETTESELVNYYVNLDFLVLDDFGAEKTTDWSLQTLYLIINGRYEQLKQTIYTGNYSLSELAVKIKDERIPRRIKQSGKVRKMTKQWI